MITKLANPERVRRDQERRRSNAAGKHNVKTARALRREQKQQLKHQGKEHQ